QSVGAHERRLRDRAAALLRLARAQLADRVHLGDERRLARHDRHVHRRRQRRSVTRNTGRSSDEYADVTETLRTLLALEEGDPGRIRIRDAVVERCLPLAEHIARRFDGRGEAFEDLLQVARLGLVNAVDRFDPERGSDFVSFAVPTIMGEVRRHFRDSGWAVRVPRRMKELHLSLSKATSELSQRLGRAPTASELADELDIPQEEVLQGLVAGNAYQTVSVDRSSPSGDDGLTLADTLGDYDAAL